MDQELKVYLDGIKHDLANFKTEFTEIKGEFGRLEARLEQKLEQKLAALKAELLEHNEVVETRLLAEFWKWARTADARYRQSNAVVGALDDRVLAIEDRVSDLERRRAS